MVADTQGPPIRGPFFLWITLQCDAIPGDNCQVYLQECGDQLRVTAYPADPKRLGVTFMVPMVEARQLAHAILGAADVKPAPRRAVENADTLV